jgi:UDPglucose 6-dehydrogenase
MDIRSAELTKYAANAMLATRISFMNELAALAERCGADIESVRQGIGSDSRIGYAFIYPGLGYGGSCFPKDVKALVRTAAEHGVDAGLIRAVEAVNERQKQVMLDKLSACFGADLAGRTFALWGLSFKPNTDDMREAPSRVLIEALTAAGALVRAHDPVALEEARRLYPDLSALTLCDDPYAAAEGADALLLVTEWRQYRSPDFPRLKRLLKQPLIFDGRNIYDARLLAGQGFTCRGIGRPVLGNGARE